VTPQIAPHVWARHNSPWQIDLVVNSRYAEQGKNLGFSDA
jgi:hypothetical protein